MENKNNLFRPEVIHHRIHRSLGCARINIPLNYRLSGYFALGIFFIMICFFYMAHLSERTFIRGYLDTDNGIISVEPDVSGLVDQVCVDEGSVVRKDQLLFIIANPSSQNSKTQLNNLKKRLANLKREYQIKETHYQAIKQLHFEQYISSHHLNEVEAQLLEIENKFKDAEYVLLQFKEHQTQHITAPADGTVTNIFYRKGQKVQPGKLLLQLVPDEVDLIARLYIPSRAIGFLKPGQTINLKYDAYPSVRFGFYEATIKEINQTILTDKQEDKPINIGEPYYKIKATLKNPYVLVYGKRIRLNHGMTLTAIITGEKKNIWQWIFDPIYSYYGEHIA